jgi:hypothetical protein
MHPTPFSFGYCTNVHAGESLDQIRANLQQHAVAVKERCSPDRPMGVGLWLPFKAAAEIVANKSGRQLADWLAERGLVPYTFNGFPFGNFHQDVVRHRVYHPTWWEDERLAYTLHLVDILHEILPAGLEGSISTLPIAWGAPCPDRAELERAAANLCQAARHMHDLEQRTGRLIYLCLEPEPGCAFSFADDAVHFFQWQLLTGPDQDLVRRHIRLCHDICHAAVMFEDQEDVLKKYRDAGIEVGKMQVSAALRMDLDGVPDGKAAEAFQQLRQFTEPRYLHQTVVDGDQFYEDLLLALEAKGDATTGEWRVHFHIPIYLKKFGLLESTQEQIPICLAAAKQYTSCKHFEVETYAWNVLPQDLQQPNLSAGIAEEMKWFDSVWSAQSSRAR